MNSDLFSAFREAAGRYESKTLIHQFSEGSYRADSYQDVLRQTQALSSYLAQRSLPRSSRVAILSENRYEWLTAAFAALRQGWVVCPLDPQANPHDWIQILRHAEAKLLFLSERFREHQEKLFEASGGLSEIILFNSQESANDPRFSSWEDVLHRGRENFLEAPPPPSADSVALLVYTSGTNGNARGVELSHSNLLSNIRAASAWSLKDATTASILPLHHTYGFTINLASAFQGMSLIFYSSISPDLLAKSFKETHPSVLTGVPTLFERIASGLYQKIMSEAHPWMKSFLNRALEGRAAAQGKTFQNAKRLLFKKVHDHFGGEMRMMISGGAPMEPKWIRLFNLLGISFFEGYGLTETSPLIACNDSENFRIGSVGRAIPGIQIRIDRPDAAGIGEILVKGPNVMRGYFKDVEGTEEALDKEHWFHTGDLGYLDRDDFLFISGRMKEVIATANGKKIYPSELEKHFSVCPLIKEICIFGIPRQGLSREEIVHAQIHPNFEWAKLQGVAEVSMALKNEIVRLSEELPEYKRPKSLSFSQHPFPKNTTQKIKKCEVKKIFLEERMRENPPLAQPGDEGLHSPVGQVVLEALRGVVPNHLQVSSQSLLALDLGLDSLSLIEFWATLQKRLKMNVPEEETFPIKSVGQVLEYLNSRQSPSQAEFSPVEVEGPEDWGNILDKDPGEIQRTAREILQSYPRSRRWFLKTFRKAFQWFSRLHVAGLENLPPNGPYILAPNHQSHLDNLFVACFLPTQIQQEMAVLGKKEHFEHGLTRVVAKLCHAIPVQRSKVSTSVLQVCSQILKNGKVLLIHPEGTRSPDGQLLPLKNGVALLASHLQCPIIPIYIEGAHEFWPKDSWRPKSRASISVNIGKPLYPRPSTTARQSAILEEAEVLTVKLKEHLEMLSHLQP